jgi:DNA (cytosine-5)-methyltransferase 1
MKAEKRVMRYGSVCSGIEAATAAWHGLGWQPSFFSEIEAFPRAVLAHHYPDVPLHGDFTTIPENEYEPIDLLVGGTPCQSFSVAGLRGGLDDDRGNLALEFCRLAQRLRPRWIVWENVPGVLSSGGGRDFGSILGALEELGYGFAYRVLDAQYFGVAQRRRRVFVVGYLGDWRPAAAVLFERHSLSGHPAPSREARKDAARAIASGAEERGGCGGDGSSVDWPADVACTLDTAFASKWGQNNQHVNAGCPLFVPSVANAITASLANAATGHNKDENVIAFDAYNQTETDEVSKTVAARNDQDTPSCVAYAVTPFDTAQISSPHNYSNPQAGDPCQPLAAGAHAPTIIAFSSNMSVPDCQTDGTTPTLKLGGHGGGNPPAVAWSIMPMNSGKDFKARPTDVAQPIMAGGPVGGNQGGDYVAASAVRRLTPRECERLQGFSDDYTAIPYRNKAAEQCPDGPRYKALGNSMAVPVMRWIGERIAQVDAIKAKGDAA